MLLGFQKNYEFGKLLRDVSGKIVTSGFTHSLLKGMLARVCKHSISVESHEFRTLLRMHFCGRDTFV